ncbi:hypothetical protein DLAC_11274 [Tieghemostelium lacteum]|uniref:Uncharacterized protein n=1 Tax=Tieghemostelium lacteum TaxID=361077 RepID=A0A151Z3M8_TIELA|nr:hypothetical protein DLAC_11274 [Tieghemostelium lacteum]|eukprot:KYQ88548.1 hypothetical protein DLAC_11274 [Tieghemostelium lacteum]
MSDSTIIDDNETDKDLLTSLLNGNTNSEYNEKVNRMLQSIFAKLHELKSRMIESQDKNQQLFKAGVDIIKSQSTTINENNQQLEQSKQNELYDKEKQEEIAKKQLEIVSLNDQIDKLHSVINILEKENKNAKLSFGDIKASFDSIIEKGRLQLKTLQNEKIKTETLTRQIIEEQNISNQLRTENTLMKVRIQEMLFLLQNISMESSEETYQSIAKSLYTENQHLRNLLSISNQIQSLPSKSTVTSSTTDEPTPSTIDQTDNSVE